MEVTTGRLQHGFRVAQKMMQMVGSDTTLCSASPNEMFILGYIHDIGYSFVDNQKDHEHAAGVLLRGQGYKYWKEVYYHGTPECEYHSAELNLLNWADMTVNQSGEDVTIDERLEDIGKRYGFDSSQYVNAVRLSKEIKQWMEANSIGQ